MNNLRYLFVAVGWLAAAPLQAQDVPASAPVAVSAAPVVLSGLAETIRERIDHLRYDQQHDARGARIILGDIVAQFYETHQFAPAWQDPARLDALVATIMDVATDGLDPADYHLEALRSYRLDLRMRTPMTAVDRADLELIATDALVLALYHVYGGKVDPLKLSSQWNYSTRPVNAERAYQFLERILATGQIREALDEVRPQHVWYQRGRERLQEYRAIAAAGGWPELPDGPVVETRHERCARTGAAQTPRGHEGSADAHGSESSGSDRCDRTCRRGRTGGRSRFVARV